MSSATLTEYTCQKAVDRDNFSRGLQQFNFSLGKPNCIDLSKSYFKIDLAIVGQGAAAENPIACENLIAIAPHATGGLYVNAAFKMSGNDVSNINQYLAQTCAIRTRVAKSFGWNRTVGDLIDNTSGSFGKRVAALSIETPTSTGLYDSENLTLRKPTTTSVTQTTSTIAIATDGTVTGVGTSFDTAVYPPTVQAVYVGDVLYVEGVPYHIVAVTGDTGLVVSPTPVNAVAASPLWYVVSPNVEGSNIQKNQMTMLYRPPLGVMEMGQAVDGALGSGDYSIQLMPDANFINNFVETANPLWNTADGYKLIINDVRFYAYTFKEIIPDAPRKFDLTETFVTSKPIQSGDSSYQFTVPPSTYKIAIWIQSQQVGSSALIPPTMFKALGVNGRTMGDTSLVAIQCIYGGVTQPSIKWSSAFTAHNAGNAASPNTNYMVQRYYDSNLFTGAAIGMEGCETFPDYLQKGPYYLFSYDVDAQSRSTDVQLSVTYNNVLISNTASANVFIAAFYRNLVEFVTSNGQIVSVQSRQV